MLIRGPVHSRRILTLTSILKVIQTMSGVGDPHHRWETGGHLPPELSPTGGVLHPHHYMVFPRRGKARVMDGLRPTCRQTGIMMAIVKEMGNQKIIFPIIKVTTGHHQTDDLEGRGDRDARYNANLRDSREHANLETVQVVLDLGLTIDRHFRYI